jgi:hypothetical protein
MIVDIEKLDWDKLLTINESFGFYLKIGDKEIKGFKHEKRANKIKNNIIKIIKDFLMQEAEKQKSMRTTKTLEIEIPVEMNIFEEKQIKELIDSIIFRKE